MKLSSVYCNVPDVFPTITFRRGLNAIFARVSDPSALNRDAHNLGKTFLIHVLDFALLKSIDKDHAFQKRSDLFASFVFYVEIRTNDNKWVTIRRPVAGRRSIAIHVSDARVRDARKLEDAQWTHTDLSLDSARTAMDKILDLSVLRMHGYDYRKGLGYVLREQGDYSDAFRIARFGRGKDEDWKPYVSMLLGFDHEAIRRKYEIDGQIARLGETKEQLELRASARSEEYDEIRGRIQVGEQSLRRLRAQVDNFSFHQAEAEISQTSAEEVESSVADLNAERYQLEHELSELERSLGAQFEFDVEKVVAVFKEMQVYLPDSLVRSYEDLVDFNQRIGRARKERLIELRGRIVQKLSAIERQLSELDARRREALRVLGERKTLEKYRLLQSRLVQGERDLSSLRERLAQLDSVAAIEAEITQLSVERESLVAKIIATVRSGPDIYKAIREEFGLISEQVIGQPAILSVTPNARGNLDFKIQLLSGATSAKETLKDRGYSYKKLLCAFFDIAVLRVYAARPFYRFVYHDGIFEGLDNRKKVTFLKMVRETCKRFGVQYILTVLDTDLPRDESDHKLLFDKSEVRRELHDGGNEGRLFRMADF